VLELKQLKVSTSKIQQLRGRANVYMYYTTCTFSFTFSQFKISVMKPNRIVLLGDAACMEEVRDAYKALVRKAEGK